MNLHLPCSRAGAAQVLAIGAGPTLVARLVTAGYRVETHRLDLGPAAALAGEPFTPPVTAWPHETAAYDVMILLDELALVVDDEAAIGEAGLVTRAARAMPIRLDLGAGMMGGAHIPARLVPDLQRLLEARTERLVRRLVEAELDGVAILGLWMEAAAYAAERGLGLYEALDVVVPEAPEADPPGARVLVPDRKRLDPALRRRLEEAAKPPKQPGLVARLLGRSGQR